MTDTEMDLYITQVEARLLKQKVKEQEDEIANLKNHVKALQDIIERQHNCFEHLFGDYMDLLLEVGDVHG